jgi:hypothetical protein
VRTQAQFAEFFDLVSASKDVAQKGIKLIKNISFLCGNLLKPTIGTPELEKFIGEVMPHTQEAQRQSIHVKTDFKAVMVTVIKVGRRRYITICGVFTEDFGELFFSRFPGTFPGL